MSDAARPSQQTLSSDAVEHGELIEAWVPSAADAGAESATSRQTNSVTEPAKVMRIGSMVKQLLEEVRHSPLDDAQPGAAGGDLRALGDRVGSGAVARSAARAADAGAAVR